MTVGDYVNFPFVAGRRGFLDSGGSNAGAIEYVGDADIFEIFVLPGFTYTLEVRGAPNGSGMLADPHLSLVSFTNTLLAQDANSGVGLNARLHYTAAQSGPVYLSAQSGNGGTGDYAVFASAGRGTDRSESRTGSARGDSVDMRGGNDFFDGGAGDDIILGGAGVDQLLGGLGGDYIDGGDGSDRVQGGAGNDVLSGGFGADVIFGGAGADRFFYNFVSGSTPAARDQFRAGDGGAAFDGVGAALGDIFDLSAIDADTTRPGNQAFVWGGTTQTGRGRLWVANSGEDTLIRGNIDGDSTVEFVIEVEDGAGVRAADWRAADFIL